MILDRCHLFLPIVTLFLFLVLIIILLLDTRLVFTLVFLYFVIGNEASLGYIVFYDGLAVVVDGEGFDGKADAGDVFGSHFSYVLEMSSRITEGLKTLRLLICSLRSI